MTQVAARLHHSDRWLQDQLAQDRRRVAPDQIRTTVCSYCGDALDAASVPLILWNEEGWCAEFCDHCQVTYWDCPLVDEPVIPWHEPEVLTRRGKVHSCRGCGRTDERACPGGCFWVAEDLCSACIGQSAPGFWMFETTGILRSAVEAYLLGRSLTLEYLAALRAYLRQWIAAPAWQGPKVQLLRDKIDGLTRAPQSTAKLQSSSTKGWIHYDR